jgi:hypothetical protein
MSSKNNFESPNHFMVLDAISKGLTSVHKITSATKLYNEEIALPQRLIVKGERKAFIFGKKKTELRITEVGSKLLNAKKQELDQKRQEMK